MHNKPHTPHIRQGLVVGSIIQLIVTIFILATAGPIWSVQFNNYVNWSTNSELANRIARLNERGTSQLAQKKQKNVRAT